MSNARVVEIAENIYWVGSRGQQGGLNCNPYLLVDEEEAVLIDPGSVLDFEDVLGNVLSIVPLGKIKYVILHHQDPDFSASVPLFEQKGANFKIITHWRTQNLVKYYGIKSDYYIVNENGFKLVLKSGRVLRFLPTPYLHFPGAIATYDERSKILFSSDLFGAFSYEWTLYAGEDYLEKMKTFHEHYMPSNDILRPIMEEFLRLDISMIAPQHGSIIRDNVKTYIKALRDMECGSFMASIKKNLMKSGGVKLICSLVIKRYVAIFNKAEVLQAIEGLELTLDKETLEITDYNYPGNRLWDMLFEFILARKGLQWLIVIEPYVRKLSQEYDIPMPEVFQTTLKQAEEKALHLSQENLLLKEINARLENSIKEVQEKLVHCPVTGLYNYDFFQNYLTSELENLLASDSPQNPALLILDVDQVDKIRFSYGEQEVNEILKNIADMVTALKEENTLLFRLQGASFACYLQHTTREAAVSFAERVRNEIASSEKFVEKITVSIGVVTLDELREGNPYLNDPAERMYNIATMRVKLAKGMGMNFVCSSSSLEKYQEEIGKILIVETDEVSIDVLKTFLENSNYKVLIARDGEEALKILETEEVDLIISEIMLPKIDGFLIRESLLAKSQTKNIPFLIVSHLKDDDTVERAAALGIEHYFRKPVMLSELLGVIKNRIKGETFR